MTANPDDWIDTRRLARELGVSKEAALSWQRATTFPREAARRDGKRVLWDVATIKQWRESRLKR